MSELQSTGCVASDMVAKDVRLSRKDCSFLAASARKLSVIVLSRVIREIEQVNELTCTIQLQSVDNGSHKRCQSHGSS
jgi:hypothetical protein